MNLLKKYHSIPVQAKATLWFMFCTIMQRCVALLTTPIFTRLMPTEQYGQFTVYNSWVQVFTILTTLRLNWAVFAKGMSKYKDDRDGYTSTMQTLTLMITVAVFAVYLLFSGPINQITELPTFIMAAMFVELMFFPAVEFWTVRMRFQYSYKAVVARTLLMAVLNAVVGVVAVLFAQEKGYARILSIIAVNFVFGVGLFAYNLKKGKKLFVKEYAVFALKFNLPLLLHYLSVYVLDQFDRIMIQKMSGMEAAALFGVASSAGMIVKVLTQSLNNAMIPWQYEKLEKKEFRALDDTMFPIFALVSVCAMGFIMFAPEVMLILGGNAYLEAVYVIPPVALGLVFYFMYSVFANVEFFFDNNKLTMYISMIGALLKVVLNYFGIGMFGYTAAAYTSLICYVFFALVHYIYMNKCLRQAQVMEQVFKPGRLVVLSAVLIILGLMIILLFPYFWLRLAIVLVALALMVIKRKQLMALVRKIRSAKKTKRKGPQE